jgi:hypothetical protein
MRASWRFSRSSAPLGLREIRKPKDSGNRAITRPINTTESAAPIRKTARQPRSGRTSRASAPRVPPRGKPVAFRQTVRSRQRSLDCSAVTVLIAAMVAQTPMPVATRAAIRTPRLGA